MTDWIVATSEILRESVGRRRARNLRDEIARKEMADEKIKDHGKDETDDNGIQLTSIKPVIASSKPPFSLPNLKPQVSVFDADIKQLMSGNKLLKISSSNSRRHRHFFLEKDEMGIRYSGSRKLCGKGDCTIDIHDIKEVRKGFNTDTFMSIMKGKKRTKIKEDRCFSIVHGARHKTVDLMADSVDTRDRWVKALSFLVKKNKHVEATKHLERYIQDHYRKADINKDNLLNLEEIQGVLHQMNVDMPKEHVRRLFDVANTRKNPRGEESLDMDEFVVLYKMLSRRREVLEILHKYSVDNDPYLDAEELQTFLEVEQKQKMSADEAVKLIDIYEPEVKAKEQNMMSVEGLTNLLTSKDQQIMNPLCTEVYQDMTLPLTQYFISSSHNTYLMEDQLRGPSSVEAYRRALRKGCRCVELDIWDGSDGQPVIYHGHTLTSKIAFRDVIQAVKEYAFKETEYPLILSFENHCSVTQQSRMAAILTEILGDMLYTVDRLSDVTALPSPDQLRGKVLIKGKKLKESPVETSSVKKEEENEDEGEVSDEDEAAEIEDDVLKDLEEKQSRSMSSMSRRTHRKGSRERKHSRKGTKKKGKVKLSKELSDMVVLKSVHFHDFQDSREKYSCYEMSSFGESKSHRLSRDSPAEYVRHNKRFLSRIYPAGTRTDSSNYEPHTYWNVGAQIVALNYQTPGKPMQANDGKFRDNGKCGYVIKPDFLRDEKIAFDPSAPPADNQRILKLKIISGQQLPKPDYSHKGEVIDPFVQVTVYGVPDDEQEEKTEWINNNGFNPFWGEEFKFVIKCPELAIVKFTVKDYDSTTSNDFIGQYTLPFTCMQQGYRHVPIFDEVGNELVPATIFIHAEVVSVAEL